MNKKIYVLMLGACAAFGANAQYQLTNSGFEEWEDVTYGSTTGQEPKNWSSFLDGSGDLQSAAAAVQLAKSSDVREGSDGSSSAMIWCRKVLLSILAQGNLTTGCVNMGEFSATNAKGNYNYTNKKRDDQSMKFTGLPDELHVWLKVQIGNASNTAKVNAVLHTNGYYQDPEENDITATVVAKAEDKTIAGTDGEWKEFVIPFAYTEGVSERPAYALVSFATCSTPGGGTAYDSSKGTGDVMYIDDISMVYFSELASLSYDGVSLLEEGKTDYELDQTYDDTKLAATVKGKGATLESSYDAETALLTITVKGDNISEDATNYHEYTIQFGKESGVASVAGSEAKVYGKDGAVEVDGFNGTVNIYTVDGRLAKSVESNGNATVALDGGIYIVRTGAKASKVVVK